VKYLPDFGIEPIVYVPENPSYPIIDENLQLEAQEIIREALDLMIKEVG
jgi:hypothetical protein